MERSVQRRFRYEMALWIKSPELPHAYDLEIAGRLRRHPDGDPR